jgi:hypothetical protein
MTTPPIHHVVPIVPCKEWEMYEFSRSDPDGVLVRVGWPSRLLSD